MAEHQRLTRLADEVEAARNFQELRAATAAAVRTLAYYASNSESALLETRERWHSGTVSQLVSGAGERAQAIPRATAFRSPEMQKNAAYVRQYADARRAELEQIRRRADSERRSEPRSSAGQPRGRARPSDWGA